MGETSYLSYLEELKKQSAGSAASRLATTPTTPEAAAEALRLGGELGIPSGVVMSDPELYRSQAEQRRNVGRLVNSPKLTDWLKTPENAALAKNDIENMSWWEKGLDFAIKAQSEGPLKAEAAIEGAPVGQWWQGVMQKQVDNRLSTIETGIDRIANAEATVASLNKSLVVLGKEFEGASIERRPAILSEMRRLKAEEKALLVFVDNPEAAAAETARLEALLVDAPTTPQPWTDIGRRVVQGAAGIPSSVARGVAELESGIELLRKTGATTAMIDNLGQQKQLLDAIAFREEEGMPIAPSFQAQLDALKKGYAILQSEAAIEVTDPSTREDWLTGDALDAYVEQQFGAIDPQFDETWASAFASGAGSLVPFAGVFKLASIPIRAGGPISAALMGMFSNADQIYQESLAAGETVEDSLGSAFWAGITGMSEAVPLEAILRFIPDSLRKNVQDNFVRWAAGTAASGGVEAVQEGFIGIMNNLQAAGAWDPERGWNTGVLTQMVVGGVLGGGLYNIGAAGSAVRRALFRRDPADGTSGGPPRRGGPRGPAAAALIKLLGDLEAAETAGTTADRLTQIDEMAAASKVKGLAPDQFNEFLKTVTDASVYVPVDEMTAYMQSENLSVEQAVERFGFEAVAFENATESGGDLAIPVAAYATRITGTPAAEWFKKHSRLDQENEVSLATAEAAIEGLDQRVADLETELETEFTAQQRDLAAETAIQDAMYRQLREAGASTRLATGQSIAYRAMMSTAAYRSNQSPIDVAEKYKLQVRGPGTVDVPTDGVLNQEQPPVDVATDPFTVEGWRDVQIDIGYETGEDTIASAGELKDALDQRTKDARTLLECLNG